MHNAAFVADGLDFVCLRRCRARPL
jgi:hypothetical protein